MLLRQDHWADWHQTFSNLKYIVDLKCRLFNANSKCKSFMGAGEFNILMMYFHVRFFSQKSLISKTLDVKRFNSSVLPCRVHGEMETLVFKSGLTGKLKLSCQKKMDNEMA